MNGSLSKTQSFHAFSLSASLRYIQARHIPLSANATPSSFHLVLSPLPPSLPPLFSRPSALTLSALLVNSGLKYLAESRCPSLSSTKMAVTAGTKCWEAGKGGV